MKLLSYKILDTETHQIGILKDQSIYNLNTLFGDISLIDLIQIDDYQNQITNFR